VSQARQIAYDVLLAVEDGAFSGETLDRALAGVDAREAGLATELVYGGMRRRAQLDELMAQVSNRRPELMDAKVRIAVEMGAYQLRFLDRIPPHAAVSESVELVKRARKAGAGALVNAVLRRLPQLPARWSRPALEYSLPDWLFRRWVSHFGLETACRIGAASLERPATYVRLAPGAAPAPGCTATGVDGCWLVTGDVPVLARRQDIGAQTIVPLLDLAPGQRVLDLCAAPGNKTLQILETSGVDLVACDASPARAGQLRALAAPNLCVHCLDATQKLPFAAEFDRILVDAPCSGTGTLARNPEIRWRLKEAELARHVTRQRAILANALRALKPGGRLVYATCSLEREENEDVVRGVAALRLSAEHYRLPGREPGDGFFAAVLR
jgi:16S rRNA (cytosine967-C5)-methyltransferase